MFEKCVKKASNLPLRKKIFLICFLSLGLLTVSSLISFFILTASNNRLLYRAVADSLSGSASEIQDELENITSISALVVLDGSIQNRLATAKDTPDAIDRNLTFSLSSSLQSYYEQFRYNHLVYMILENENLPNEPYMSTYIRSDMRVPDSVYRQLLLQAQGNHGMAVWVTSYADPYGLFLVREIRRVRNVQLDTLGILIMNIDAQSMLADQSGYSRQNVNASFALSDGESIIAISGELNAEDVRSLEGNFDAPYRIANLSSGKYFVVKNTIPGYNWNLYSLVPYNSVYFSTVLSEILFFCALFFSLIFALLLSHHFIRSITFHVENLIRKIRIFGESNGGLADSGVDYDYSQRNDEFGIIHQNFDQMTRQIHHLIHVNYQNELLVRDAQIKALETQINPHFLYNTLESINWRAKKSGETEISQMVEALGGLLRAALSQGTKTFSLQQELDFVQCYLTIQKMRFEEQLSFSIFADETLLDMQVPKLIIQPLVENAIQYAMEEMTEECVIQINIFRENDLVIIEVKNTGSRFSDDLLEKLREKKIQPNGFGIGLLNIHHRLQLTFGAAYGLKFYNSGGFAVAQIIMPDERKERETHVQTTDRR